MAKSKNLSLARILYSAMFLALAVLMPVVEGVIGWELNLISFFTLLCGFLCGPNCGLVVGAVAPFVYSLIFDNGNLLSDYNIILALSLAAAAFVGGLLYKRLGKSLLLYFVEAVTAVICGILIWCAATVIISWVNSGISLDYIWATLAGHFSAFMYISTLLRIIAIPLIVNIFRKNRLILN